MIRCFCGVPGAGKTYDAVRTLLDALKSGRIVYTNIDGFTDPECQEYQKIYCNLTDFQYSTSVHFLTKEQVYEFWKYCEPGALIVIDEIQKHFSNRDWNTSENRGFVDWAETHRHQGYDLIMMTHSTEKVDKHVRSLIDWTYVYDKVNYFGSLVKNSYTVNAFKFDQDRGKPIKSNTRRYDPSVFKCYMSYDSKDIKEQGFSVNINVLKHPIFFIIPVALCLFLYLLFYKSSLGTGDIFGHKRFERIKTEALSKRNPVEAAAVPQKSVVIPYEEVVKGKMGEKVRDGEVKSLAASQEKLAGRVLSGPVVASEGARCRVVGEIEDGSDVYEMSRCGCLEVKKKNGVVIYSKELSANRCGSSSSVAFGGPAAARKGGSGPL